MSGLSYEAMRGIAKDGDKLFVRGMAFIRVMTGEAQAHVAVLFWMDGGLFVAEFTAKTGYIIMPASQWFDQRKGQEITYGQAPDIVRNNPISVRETIYRYRAMDTQTGARRWFGPNGYGFASLLKVWWSQVTGWAVSVRQKVCSTFAQEVDEACGLLYSQTADPGDVARTCILYPMAG